MGSSRSKLRARSSSQAPRSKVMSKAESTAAAAANIDKELRAVFEQYDQNGDGTIDQQELAEALTAMNDVVPSNIQIARLMAKVDTNHDGKIDFDEFKDMMQARGEERERLKVSFRNFDKDKDGFITIDELLAGLKTLSPDTTKEEVNEVFKAADKNNDGQICLSEFLDYFA